MPNSSFKWNDDYRNVVMVLPPLPLWDIKQLMEVHACKFSKSHISKSSHSNRYLLVLLSSYLVDRWETYRIFSLLGTILLQWDFEQDLLQEKKQWRTLHEQQLLHWWSTGRVHQRTISRICLLGWVYNGTMLDHRWCKVNFPHSLFWTSLAMHHSILAAKHSADQHNIQILQNTLFWTE